MISGKRRAGLSKHSGEEENLLFLVRKEILNLLAEEKISPEEALLAAFYILLDLKGRKKSIPADVRDCFSEKTKKNF
ncbi:MAG: hypothetical protein ACLR2E_02545 [Lachnospiraceae bacterium]